MQEEVNLVEIVREKFYSKPSRKSYVERIRNKNPNVLRSFRSYLFEGRECGGFVKACLENDLSSTVGYADDDMRNLIPEVVMYLTNCFPAETWGSKEAYRKIIENQGYFNLQTREDVLEAIEWAERQGV